MALLKKLKTSLTKSLRTGKFILYLAISLIAIRIFYGGMRWLGLKGLIGIMLGMSVMAALMINKKTAYLLMFCTKAIRGEENLLSYMRKEK
jgi:hypothetical protein